MSDISLIRIFEVQGRKVFGWVVEDHGMIMEIHTTEPGDDLFPHKPEPLGMLFQHKNGHWAATWNLCPTDPEDFPYATEQEAVEALAARYPEAWRL